MRLYLHRRTLSLSSHQTLDRDASLSLSLRLEYVMRSLSDLLFSRPACAPSKILVTLHDSKAAAAVGAIVCIVPLFIY